MEVSNDATEASLTVGFSYSSSPTSSPPPSLSSPSSFSSEISENEVPSDSSVSPLKT